MSTKPSLQKMLRRIIPTEEEEKQSQTQNVRKKKKNLIRGIDEPMRARKISSMINSANQQNLKLNSAKSKEQSTRGSTWKKKKKAIETQESVNTSHNPEYKWT
jgi:hypothetical protein